MVAFLVRLAWGCDAVESTTADDLLDIVALFDYHRLISIDLVVIDASRNVVWGENK